MLTLEILGWTFRCLRALSKTTKGEWGNGILWKVKTIISTEHPKAIDCFPSSFDLQMDLARLQRTWTEMIEALVKLKPTGSVQARVVEPTVMASILNSKQVAAAAKELL